MRKSIWTVLFTALVALVAVSCAKETDLTDVKNKIDELDQRVTALEKAVEKINKETVPGFENLVKALNEKLTVVSVIEGTDGVTITFSDGTTSVITNGKDGKDGADGKDGENGKDGEDGKDGADGKNGENGKDAQAPEINITLIDGVYYWTVNGELLKDGDGNPIPVSTPGPQGDKGDKGDKGDQGEQGITPLFGTSSEGKVIVSYDNGETWKPLGFSVIDGSAFTSAYIDQDKSTDDYIVLVVGETEVQIPKEKNFSLKINYEGDLSAVGANAGDNIAIEYEVEGASDTDKVTVDVLSATAGITATIQKVDALHGYILIGVPAADPAADPAKVSGKIFVFADNNKGKTNIKVISLEEGEISAVADVSAQVPAAGGEIPLTVTTNKEYNVNISDGATSWLHVVDTKATHVDELTIVADPNTSGAYRVGVVSINDRNSGELIAEYTVLQQPASDVATDLGSIRQLADGTAVTGQKAIVVASSQVGALVVDENAAYIYLAYEGNTAVRGDEVSFAGVKQTTEDTKVKYVEASTLTVTASAQEVADLPVRALRSHLSGNSLNTGVSGLLQKNGDVYYVDVQEYVYYFPNVIIEPTLGLDLEPLVDKYVTVKGYTNGSYVDYDDNDEFTADSYVDFIALSAAEVTFEANPNWTLKYEGEKDGKDAISNTVSGGSDYWFNYAMNVYSVEEAAEFESLEALARYECFSIAEVAQYWFDAYHETIDDDATTESDEVSLGSLAYGKYIVVAVGLNEDGFVSGKYATLQFEKEDPHVAAAYEDFIGTWKVGGAEWTISQDVEGVSYIVKGVMGSSYDFDYEGLFIDGKFAFMEKDFGSVIDGYDHVTMGGQYYSSAYGEQWGLNYNLDEPSVIFTAGKLNDGTFDIVPGQLFTYKYNYMSLWGQSASDGSPKEFSYKSMPTTFVWVDPNAEVSPLEKNYTADDIVSGVELEKLTGTQWVYFARVDGEIAADREAIGYVTFEDDGTGAVVNASGLFEDLLPGVMQFNYSQGFIYSGNYVGEDGTYSSYTLKPVVLNASGGVYTSVYANWLAGGYVADGIIALVDPGAYSSQGVNTAGFGVGAFSGTSYAGWFAKYGHIILVDPAILTSTSIASSSTNTLNAGSAISGNILKPTVKKLSAQNCVETSKVSATVSEKEMRLNSKFRK